MFDFNTVIDRRVTNSIKWNRYGEDVLPLWVADMDFAAPEPIRAALRGAVEHGIHGYEAPTRGLMETVASRMEKLYGWKVSPEAVVATPGVIAGFNAAARTLCQAGEGMLIQPPVYPPFHSVHSNHGMVLQQAQLECLESGDTIRYRIDREAFDEATRAGETRTGMFLLCNPHNPTGQVFSREDLTHLAESCLRRGVRICSDEIHSELLLSGAEHLPIACLEAEVAKQTITLVAPSKTFNIPGLFCAFAIIPDPELCAAYKKNLERMALHVNSLGLTAAQAAFSGECDPWLSELLLTLTQNRDHLLDEIRLHFPGIRSTRPEATYLAWLDCRDLIRSGRMEGPAHKFFLEKAKVALNDGAEFGPGGEGFVRLNFGCPRALLDEALERMKNALG